MVKGPLGEGEGVEVAVPESIRRAEDEDDEITGGDGLLGARHDLLTEMRHLTRFYCNCIYL